MIRARFVIAAALLALLTTSSAEPPPRIAIIIDDLGYQYDAGRRAIELPGPVAFAVLPRTPYGTRLATMAHAAGKDVLLHLPLEAVERDGPEEPGEIALDMSHNAFRANFAEAMAAVPNAIGVSSHRGSLLTQHPGHMAWLMREIRGREALFFIDSFTTRDSVALRIAAEEGVPATRRDVFLDHERTIDAVTRELQKLRQVARRKGQAIAIGHPFPETLEVLERELPRLVEEGFELVTISELIARKRNRI